MFHSTTSTLVPVSKAAMRAGLTEVRKPGDKEVKKDLEVKVLAHVLGRKNKRVWRKG